MKVDHTHTHTHTDNPPLSLNTWLPTPVCQPAPTNLSLTFTPEWGTSWCQQYIGCAWSDMSLHTHRHTHTRTQTHTHTHTHTHSLVDYVARCTRCPPGGERRRRRWKRKRRSLLMRLLTLLSDGPHQFGLMQRDEEDQPGNELMFIWPISIYMVDPFKYTSPIVLVYTLTIWTLK